MRRPFAMWIETALATRVRGPQTLLSGVPLGPAPESRDALHVHAPFSRPLRVHCKSVLSHPRGAEDMRFTFGIDGDLPLLPAQYVGAAVVEEGVVVRAFTARLRSPAARYHAPARFDLGADRAWGLVSVRGHLLNILVVGGGLARDEDFWPSLVKIEPQNHAALERASLSRVSAPFALDAGYWQLPTCTIYPRGEWESALVVPSNGPVTDDSARVFVDGAWRDSELYQQPGGLTQICIASGPAMDLATVIAPFSKAA
jgi:hypothetical protein